MDPAVLGPILRTGVIPGGVALAALVLVWRPWRGGRVRARHPVPIATALGFLVGCVSIVGWQGSADVGGAVGGVIDGSVGPWDAIRGVWSGLWRGLWPVDPVHRMGQYGLLGLAGALMVSRLPESEALRWLLVRLVIQMGVVSGAVLMLLWPLVSDRWGPGMSVGAVLGLGVAGTIWWSVIGGAAVRRPGALVGSTLAAVSVVSAATLVPAGHGLLALQTVMLGVVLLVCAVAALVRPKLTETRAVGAVPAVAFAVLWGGGVFYAPERIPAVSLVLLGVSPLAVWVSRAPRVREWRAWRSGLAQVVVAVVLAWSAGAIASVAPGRGDKEPGSLDTGGWDSAGEGAGSGGDG